MSDFFSLSDFLEPLDPYALSGDEGYRDKQIGTFVLMNTGEIPDLTHADLVIIGCGGWRGAHISAEEFASPNAIRHQLYSLYFWHNQLKIADLGNVRRGASVQDTYVALSTVIKEMMDLGKTVIILGGSHDLTLAQYEAYRSRKQVIEAICIDALIDLSLASPLRSENFLMEMLTGEPNYIRQYNHLAFQSYLVHPDILETLDKLGFDCYRLGHVREFADEVEPLLRDSNMLSIDISALAHSAAPANRVSPNGLNGEEICTLTQHAGMAPNLNSIGVYGYRASQDEQELTAKQIAHMLWYFIDGRFKGLQEASLEDREHFNEFYLQFAEVETEFIQSKRTGRWWAKLPSGRFISCSYKDYLQASNNELPERWMRALERE